MFICYHPEISIFKFVVWLKASAVRTYPTEVIQMVVLVTNCKWWEAVDNRFCDSLHNGDIVIAKDVQSDCYTGYYVMYKLVMQLLRLHEKYLYIDDIIGSSTKISTLLTILRAISRVCNVCHFILSNRFMASLDLIVSFLAYFV